AGRVTAPQVDARVRVRAAASSAHARSGAHAAPLSRQPTAAPAARQSRDRAENTAGSLPTIAQGLKAADEGRLDEAVRISERLLEGRADGSARHRLRVPRTSEGARGKGLTSPAPRGRPGGARS